MTTPTAAPPEPYSFGRSATMTAEKVAIYEQAGAQMATRMGEALNEILPGFTVEAGQLLETASSSAPEGGESGGIDRAPLVSLNLESGEILTDEQLALTLVTGVLGGAGLPPGDARPLTSIEQRVLDLVTGSLLGIVTEALLVEESLTIDRDRARAAFSAAADDDDGAEALIGFPFEVRGPVGGGTLTYQFPVSTVQQFSDAVDRKLSGRRAVAPSVASARTVTALQPVPLPFAVGFGHITLTAQQVVELAPGDVIRTGLSIEAPLTGAVGDRDLFRVRPGQRGQRLTAEIIALCDRSSSIMDGPTDPPTHPPTNRMNH